MPPTPTLIRIRPKLRSIRYRAYAEPVGGTTLLAWCVSRIRSAAQGPVVVACPVGDEEIVRALLADVDVRVIASHCTRETDVILDVGTTEGWGEVVAVELEHGFVPPGVIRGLHDFHEGGKYTASTVVGVPSSAGADVVPIALLRALADLRIPNLPAHQRSVFEHLEQIQRQGLVDLQFTFGRYLCRNDTPTHDDGLPFTVGLETPADASIARRVVEAGGSDEWDLLTAWRRLAVADGRQRRRRTVDKRDAAPTRVLFVSNPSAFAAAEESLVQLAAHLDAARFTAAGLVALDGAFADHLRHATGRVFCPNVDFSAPRVANVEFLLDVFSKFRPHIVHCHANNGMATTLAASLCGIPIVQHVRVCDLTGWTDALEAASAIVAVSGYVKQLILRRDVHADTVHTVYDGVDTSRFYPGAVDRRDAKTSLGTGDAFTIAMVGRFAQSERHDLLLEAVSRVSRSQSPPTVLLAGEAIPGESCLDQVLTQIESLSLAAHVRVVGFHPDIRVVLAAADVVVLSSDREPLGTTILQAMAMGLPVIVTGCGGPVEILAQRAAGLLVPPNDADSLASALQTVMTDRHARERLSARAAALIRAEFTAGHAATAMAAVYERTLAAAARATPIQGRGKRLRRVDADVREGSGPFEPATTSGNANA